MTKSEMKSLRLLLQGLTGEGSTCVLTNYYLFFEGDWVGHWEMCCHPEHADSEAVEGLCLYEKV